MPEELKLEDLPDTLPNKLWELGEVALADLEKTEKESPDYIVDMNRWHEPRLIGCHVCLAGSVLAQRYHIPKQANVMTPSRFVNLRYKLQALDYLRAGKIQAAAHQLRQLPCETPENELRRLRRNERLEREGRYKPLISPYPFPGDTGQYRLAGIDKFKRDYRALLEFLKRWDV